MKSYTSDEENCVMQKLPTIKEIADYYGKPDKGTESWINDMIRFICNASSVYPNDFQMVAAYDTIIDKCSNYKPCEFMLFCSKFMGGQYKSFYDQKFDVQVIARSLDLFGAWRGSVISKYDLINDSEVRQKRRNIDGNETRKQYVEMLQKGIYGDKMSLDALGLKTDEQIARCAAVCISRGEFLPSIKDKINPEYHQLIDTLVERMKKRQSFVDAILKKQ